MFIPESYLILATCYLLLATYYLLLTPRYSLIIFMDAEEMLKQQLKEEGDLIAINLLNELGNRAIEMGLIVGHGYHGGKYEILRKGEIITLTPLEAQTYLQNLIAEPE